MFQWDISSKITLLLFSGISLVHSFNDLDKALSTAFGFSDTILIEDFIAGREFRCSVIEKCTNGKVEVIAMPPMEYLINQKGIRDIGQKLLVDERGLPLGNLKDLFIRL